MLARRGSVRGREAFMSNPPRLAWELYHLILRVQPSGHINIFGDEMYKVFVESAEDARAHERLSWFVLKEP